MDQYALALERTCKSCGRHYTVGDYWHSNKHYFEPPYDYNSGCQEYCLNCWLVGDDPEDQNIGEMAESEFSEGSNETIAPNDTPLFPINWDDAITLSPASDDGWPYANIYEELCSGDLLTTYQWYFERGHKLAVMPVGRLKVNRIVTFPRGFVFYPKGYLDLEQLRIVANSTESGILSEAQSEASGISESVFSRYALVVFPHRLNWDLFRSASHNAHLDLIRELSEAVDGFCLDYARYKTCRLEPIEDLPCRAGQVPYTNSMMSCLAIYSPEKDEGRIIGGAAFTHCVTIGLGMILNQFEWDQLPANGEVGEIARRALVMYTQLLEANSQTSKFVQAMSLLEFLAYPDQYEKFEKVKSVIARYLAPVGSHEYCRVLDRFFELTGKSCDHPERKQANGTPEKVHVGFRTRIVHLGHRLEQILPERSERIALFHELESYICPVINHMIKHSSSDFETYREVRNEPFTNANSNQSESRPNDDFDIPF